MSALCFTRPEETLTIHPAERARLGRLAKDIAIGVLRPVLLPSRLRLRGADHLDALTGLSWQTAFASWFHAEDGDGGFVIAGQVVTRTDLALNTLVELRSPIAALIAQLYGAWGWRRETASIDADDARWFAGLLDRGVRGGMLGAGAGWEDVAEAARRMAREPGDVMAIWDSRRGPAPRRVIGRITLKTLARPFASGDSAFTLAQSSSPLLVETGSAWT